MEMGCLPFTCSQIQHWCALIDTMSASRAHSPSRVLCHEHRRSTRRCTTVREMKGGPFGFGDQVVYPKPPQAALAKSHGGERCGNVGAMIPTGTLERGERKRTASEASKA